MQRHGSMNHIYRLVWSHVLNAWVAVAETTRGRGKGTRRKLAALAALALAAPAAWAAPAGGQVVGGAGSISQSGATTTIRQNSAQLSLNWNSFNVGAGETVNFVQPSATALAVNRIFDSNGTQILGRLNANGQVYLINPNGILFGRGAQVDVGGLVATTLDIADAGANGARRHFAGKGEGGVVNEGSIRAADGGYVALLGRRVSNRGDIQARAGAVALGGGSAATLTFAGNRLLQLQIDDSTLNALAENGGLIRADGGLVRMSAGARDSVLASVVNNTGVIEARTVEQREGSIVLLGGMAAGSTHVSGTLDAGAPGAGNGGFIETSAARVKVDAGARISTAAPAGASGTWLIDPVDFTVAASGGDISGATLSDNLRHGSVTIQSTAGRSAGAGDLHVNDSVTWSANKLTLNAERNININAPLYGSATASLALEYGQGAVAAGNNAVYRVLAPVNLAAGEHFSTKLGSDGARVDYTVITALGQAGSASGTDLQGINGKLDGNYVLGADIDATATLDWDGGAGFQPLGGNSGQFSGQFDGLGHSVQQLTIARGQDTGVGLFGYVGSGASVRNVGIAGGDIRGEASVGGLAGVNNGSIVNSFSSANVYARARTVGGLVGANRGSIADSYASGRVGTNSNSAGGLVGENGGGPLAATISGSYATGIVSGAAKIGGLVGNNSNGAVRDSYASATIRGGSSTGGLVGYNSGQIYTSYAASSIDVTGPDVGGLVGFNDFGRVSDSYWNIERSGQGESAGGTGLSDADMRTASSFSGFTFGTAPGASGWVIVDAKGTLNNAGDNPGATAPMLLSEYRNHVRNAHQLQLMLLAKDASYTLGASIDAAATAGRDVWSASGFVPVGRDNRDNQAGNADEHAFGGSFDGNGHTINALTINSPERDYVGLFGYTSPTSVIRNVGLLDAMVTGHFATGALAGSSAGLVSNSHASGEVHGTGRSTGGLVGENFHGTVERSHATATVNGADNRTGGLVGENFQGTISDSYASGAVSSTEDETGGLVGNNSGSIINSYATGAVSSERRDTGGLVGFNDKNATIHGSYASGAVSGKGRNVGGLVGGNSGAIGDSHASGTVSGGANRVGGLVGENEGLVSASHATGAVSGQQLVGGLVGDNSGSIDNSHASGNANAEGEGAGGLVGENSGAILASHASGAVRSMEQGAGGLAGFNTEKGSIRDSHASGAVSSDKKAGGLVGENSGVIGTSYATGNASGRKSIGGLAGANYGGGIDNSYATGTADASADNAGGLVGYNQGGSIANSYASGHATGDHDVGGLVGYNSTEDGDTAISLIRNSYATGGATGKTMTGALVGRNNGSIDSSFWNSTLQETGVGENNGTLKGVRGLSTAQLQSGASFAGWDMASAGGSNAVWRIYEGSTTPLLRSFLTQLTITADNIGKVYDARAHEGGLVNATYSRADAATSAQLFNRDRAYAGKVNVGKHGPALYSGQQGYDISYVNGTLTVTPATLTYRAAPSTFTAGQALTGLTGSVTGWLGNDTQATASSGTLRWSSDATSASPAGRHAIQGAGLSAENYVFVQAEGNATALTLAAVTPTPTPTPIAIPAATHTAVAQLQSDVLGSLTGSRPDALQLSPTITVSHAETAAPADATQVNTTVQIGSRGPALQIVLGGVKLPANTLNVNQ
ncbi:GLUG motif-containing protein [Janthinobacterium fluminis]|uniref:GLUG motif-containing protein n=1 Tax=Janthinobacterium fluminis TaxID=2987524 RepID=A0ABT5JYM6_9BURK|nr:GLUG motif-containing protein [Janthinobacterium fluminis]MDC8757835.1 GLUG motif-containing protein [Janthinobacterium fluminis]